MSYAAFAAACITAYCKERWPEDVKGMSKTIAPDLCDRFGGFSHTLTHKYIQDLEDINEALGAKQGKGVYGCAKYSDGSRLLFTCDNGIPVIDERGLVT